MAWVVAAALAAAGWSWAAVLDYRALLFLPLAASVIGVEAMRRKKLSRYDFLTLANLVFLVGYAVSPVAILMAGTAAFYSPELAERADTSDETVALIAALATAAYWALVAGYRAAGGATAAAPWASPEARPRAPLSLLAWAAFLVGSVAFAIYASLYGGVGQLLVSAALIRASELEPPSAWVFLVHFTPLTVVSAWWCVWRAVDAATLSRRALWLAPLLVLLGFAVLTQAATAGRTIVLVVLASTLLAPYVWRGALPSAKILIPAGVVAFVFIVIGKQLFGLLAWGTELASWSEIAVDAPLAFVREFTHLYLGVQHALDAVPARLDPRFGVDLLVGLQWLLPGQLFGLERAPSITHWNTELATGEFVSIVPPGLVGYGYYAILLPGVALVPAAYGFAMGYVENALLRLWGYDRVVVCFYIVCAIAFGYGVMNADPRVFMVTNFWVALLGLGTVTLVLAWRGYVRAVSGGIRPVTA
jgi:hypothetical protein